LQLTQNAQFLFLTIVTFLILTLDADVKIHNSLKLPIIKHKNGKKMGKKMYLQWR
jgi:hypothetical protein